VCLWVSVDGWLGECMYKAHSKTDKMMGKNGGQLERMFQQARSRLPFHGTKPAQCPDLLIEWN